MKLNEGLNGGLNSCHVVSQSIVVGSNKYLVIILFEIHQSEIGCV